MSTDHGSELLINLRVAPEMARGIHCCPNYFLFILADQCLFIVKNMFIYTHA
jgi:hypothetical protein